MCNGSLSMDTLHLLCMFTNTNLGPCKSPLFIWKDNVSGCKTGLEQNNLSSVNTTGISMCLCLVKSDSLRPHGLQPARLLCPDTGISQWP